ncbi:MAG: hypothetical protein KGI28_09975 [Thaumarchaeota archaeon]|nr:hypothetical protein [Nitrososphaerota archaeon]
MTEWHTVPAKFTTEEKKILDALRDVYGLSHNQSLRKGLEIFARFLILAEYYATADSKTLQKIGRVGKKYIKMMNNDTKKILEKTPTEQQEAEYEKFSSGVTKILTQFDNIFIQNRKKGRKKLPKKKGRPSTRL